MFRYVVLILATALLFVGCAFSYEMWVSVSDGKGDYSIYCDGKQVCPTSDYCRFKSSTSEDAIYLEARKYEIVYGNLWVNRGESSYHFSAGLLRYWPFFSDGRGHGSVAVTMLFLDMIALPVAVVTAVVPTRESGKFPTEVTIPIIRNDSTWVSPWDKPFK